VDMLFQNMDDVMHILGLHNHAQKDSIHRPSWQWMIQSTSQGKKEGWKGAAARTEAAN